DLDQARDLSRQGRASLEELGWKAVVAITSLDYGFLELAGGDLVAAERELRRDYATLEAMGEKNYISTTAGVLAEVLYQQGRDDEAEGFAKTSEEIADEEDLSTQALWRCVRGKVA